MTNSTHVLLTAADLIKWREEDKMLDEQIRELQQRRSENKRKLDAAEVFAEALSIGPPSPPSPSVEEGSEIRWSYKPIQFSNFC